MIREKQITIIKMRIKVDIKINLNQILRDGIEKKKIQSKIYRNEKFGDQIWYNQQITWYFKIFTISVKCFSSKIKEKHFPRNQVKFFFD